MEVWDNGYLDQTISDVVNILEKVLCLTNEGKGGNDLVETKRGTKDKDLNLN